MANKPKVEDEVVPTAPELEPAEEVVEEPVAEGAEAEVVVEESPKVQTGEDVPLSESDKERGFVRPFRSAVLHVPSKGVYTLGDGVAADLATDPKSHKKLGFPGLGERPVGEFIWQADKTKVGS